MRSLVCALSVLFSLPLLAETPDIVAVISVDNGAEKSDALAAAIRQELVAQGARVLSAAEMQERTGAGSFTPSKIADLRALTAKARAAYDDFKFAESVQLYEQALAAITADPQPSNDVVALLQETRIAAAGAGISWGDKKETGRAETEGGKKARAFLADAVRANPLLTLDAAEYPPRLRKILDLARADVAKSGNGSLTVTSNPVGAAVFLDGRRVGVTPLRLAEAAPRGAYWVWVEQAGKRSLPRRVDLREGAPSVDIDLELDALWVAGGSGMRLVPPDLNEDLARRAAKALGASWVLFVTKFTQDGTGWGGVVVYDAAADALVRRGALRGDDVTAARGLASFGRSGRTTNALTTLSAGPFVLGPSTPRVVLVLPIESDGDVAGLEERWRDELAKVQGNYLVAREQTSSVLQQAKSAEAACLENRECLARMGNAANAGMVVRTVARRNGAASALSVRVISVALPDDRRIEESVTTEDALRPLAVRTLAPEKYSGGLKVQGAMAGARVSVDGVEVGTLPMSSSVDGLHPGPHIVRVSGPGPADAQERITVEFNRTITVVAEDVPGKRLIKASEPTPEPPPSVATAPTEAPRASSPVAMVLLGVGGAALAAGAVGLLVGLVTAGGSLAGFALQPRDDDGRPLTAFAFETAELLTVRTIALLTLPGVGLLVALVGLVVVGAGVASLVGGLVMRE